MLVQQDTDKAFRRMEQLTTQLDALMNTTPMAAMEAQDQLATGGEAPGAGEDGSGEQQQQFEQQETRQEAEPQPEQTQEPARAEAAERQRAQEAASREAAAKAKRAAAAKAARAAHVSPMAGRARGRARPAGGVPPAKVRLDTSAGFTGFD